jgi:hypothetical protein
MQPSELISKVRKRLRSSDGLPLFQSPSPETILEIGVSEFQNATMRVNNKGDAWAIKEYVLTTTDDTRRYLITQPDFGKALSVVTVPEDSRHFELELEFTELEQIPNDWAWLSNTQSAASLWQSYGVSQSARYVAFYRQLETGGFKNYMEIRPSPIVGENYRVLYQVGEWGSQIASDLNFAFPFPEVGYYFIALTANCLLPYTRWTSDAVMDAATKAELKNQFVEDLQRYQETFDNFVASLHRPQLVYAESFADAIGL